MPPELVIFDCDGVLIDSEHIAAEVIADDLTRLGWKLTSTQAKATFLGMSIADMQPMIETRLGHALPPGWRDALAAALLKALELHAMPILGARDLLLDMNARGIPWRVASNSSPAEMAVKFSTCGLADLVEGRTFSAATVIAAGGRAKPAPDLYLAVAAACRARPARCVVLEDSKLGVTAAVAAGMTVYGFRRYTLLSSFEGDAPDLLAAGAKAILTRLDQFPGVCA